MLNPISLNSDINIINELKCEALNFIDEKKDNLGWKHKEEANNSI